MNEGAKDLVTLPPPNPSLSAPLVLLPFMHCQLTFKEACANRHHVERLVRAIPWSLLNPTASIVTNISMQAKA